MSHSLLRSLFRFVAYPSVAVSPERLDEHYAGRWIVLTGASRGIGQAVARRLIAARANLLLVARSVEPLTQLQAEAEAAGVQAICRAVDLRDRAALCALCDELHAWPVDVGGFFCVAGKSIRRPLDESLSRLHDFDRTMDLNYRAMVALSLCLAPALRRSGGCIVYASSVSALFPPAPGWAGYHASKCAADVWCQTAQSEWAMTGPRVQIAYLPLVHTSMSEANALYRRLPAYSADEAALLLLRLSISHARSYRPWWSTITAPLAWLLSPVVRRVYECLCLRAHASDSDA